MRLNYLFLFTILFLSSFQLSSQCDIVPSVIGDLMLCPESEGILHTSSFESYQWFKRPFSADEAELINGATDSFLVVNYFNDVPAWFSVEVSYDSCLVMSDEYLLDGYVFLPPFVESVGDFSVGSEGEIILCNQDTVEFIFSMDKNIQWYRNFEPIPGAIERELKVFEGGGYHAEGAPEECPDFIMNLGLIIEVIKKDIDAVTPLINQLIGDIFYIENNENFIYREWYCVSDKEGELTFIGTDSTVNWFDFYGECHFGPFLVRAIDHEGCMSWSDEFHPIINSVDQLDFGVKKVFPNPALDFVHIDYSKPMDGLHFQLFCSQGRLLQNGALTGIDQDRIDLSNFHNGYYLLVLKTSNESIEIQLVKK